MDRRASNRLEEKDHIFSVLANQKPICEYCACSLYLQKDIEGSDTLQRRTAPIIKTPAKRKALTTQQFLGSKEQLILGKPMPCTTLESRLKDCSSFSYTWNFIKAAFMQNYCFLLSVFHCNVYQFFMEQVCKMMKNFIVQKKIFLMQSIF